MFRRALRLGARVSVASCAAVVPATAAACLSDVVCVPHGRFTQEQEETLKDLVTIFGHGLVQHAVVAVTHAMEKNKRLLDRTELFDEISKLPPKAFLRRFVEDCEDRVVGVENRL